VITRHKELVDGVASIDDWPSQRAHARPHIIFDTPYNHDEAGLRLQGWDDPELPNVLEAARQAYLGWAAVSFPGQRAS
jgi:hypothetical protein